MGCRRGELPVLGAVLALALLVGPRVLAQRADIELVPALSGGDGPGPVTYSGYQVLRVQVTGTDTAELLRSYENNPGAHFWSESAVQEGPVDVMVSPDVGRRLKEELTRSGASYTVNIEDVQEAIKRENPSDLLQPRLQVRQSLQQGHPLTWRKYHRLADHHQYLDFVALRYGDLCETFSIGTSTEGRDIRGVKCGRGKREIWIDGGIHAREWISPAVVSYLIREFSERSTTSNDILSNFTLYIIPVLNPDGYEYSHTHDRMWRKTRSKNADSTCIGVDANRNFDISWGKSGTSQEPCAVTYGGPHPFSEPETRAIRDFVLAHKDKLEMFITLHSYSELLFVPYAFTIQKPDDYDEVRAVAERGVAALRAASGREFSIPRTTPYNQLSGVSDDWAKAVAGVRFTYTFELRDKGAHGFLLPAEQIEPSGREIAAAIKAMIRALPAPQRQSGDVAEHREAAAPAAGKRAAGRRFY
ncbi:carboxypeptidase B-like [Amphibalanus amphitrite]|uniref:carboxypeptidase B-like n=1 Tax=Amphibalanus amphitrite TaxID=1232801 RepID=UPI001C924652|nr:carboxypeptidase B-like [Amphibalanus amphitrite]